MRKSEIQKYSFLDSLVIMLDFKFDPIKLYLDNTQEMIAEQEKILTKKIDDWDKKHKRNPEAPSGFDFYEIEMLNKSEFSNILYQSIFLTIYSTFESEFFKLCESCQEIENLKIGPKDINGKGYIDQYRKYVTKVLDVNLDSLNQKWVEIRNYQLIRNSIAHNNGTLKSPKKEFLTFIEISDGISFDINHSKIKIESIVFLKSLIDKLTVYLTETAKMIMDENHSRQK